MSRANSLGSGMQTGYPLLKANVYAAQLKAAPVEAVAPNVAEKPVVVKKEKAAPVATAPAKKRKIVVKVNPAVAKLMKKKAK